MTFPSSLLALLARAWDVVSWLIALVMAAFVLLAFWIALKPVLAPDRRRGGRAPRAVVSWPDDTPVGITRVTPYQQDLGDEDEQADAVQEGFGIHPRGHHVTPLEQLTASERRLWDEARKGITA